MTPGIDALIETIEDDIEVFGGNNIPVLLVERYIERLRGIRNRAQERPVS